MLPIPFSMEDMLEITRTNGIAMTVIADNLLQMAELYPDKIDTYRRLIVHSCLNAGGEAARDQNHPLSNHYFLRAADFAPNYMIVHQNLARSFQRLHAYRDAIDHYWIAIQLSETPVASLWIYLIECLYELGEVEHARGITQTLLRRAEEAGLGKKLGFGVEATHLLAKDHAPEELQDLFKGFFTP